MDENITLEIKDLSHTFDGEKFVLYAVNLKVKTGEIVSVVGPSGCGKSTLLRAIVGTHPPTKGQVIVYGGVNKANPEVVLKTSRDCGIVYQRYSLFPNLNALENVALGLMLDQSALHHRLCRWIPFGSLSRKGKGKISWSKLRKEHLKEAEELLNKVKLGYAMDRYPHQMSGGECQRVAIAQALIMKPRILLLDEPFGALDEATRGELQAMLLTLYEENIQSTKAGKMPPYTILIVTHELKEAILVGDRVIGLSQYWKSQDHENIMARGSASIVYDSVAPVHRAGQVLDYDVYMKTSNEIRQAVFNPEFLQERDEYRKFWVQLRDGKGEGVLSRENN
ncbi:MAG: ATP-binding cassette domain-containing protein [Planctomycetes bacterium]|nr:ATP-binding cassette domain-containing protein [Planctomycetota bacterium]